ncbi:MAG: hypothetical protein ACI9MR_001403, partial [Myxococcota bacterium]
SFGPHPHEDTTWTRDHRLGISAEVIYATVYVGSS